MRIVMMGPPGVGKGTYAALLSPKLGLPKIATGDLIRNEIRRGTPIGRKIQQYNDSGKLVPDDVVGDLLKTRLELPDAQRGFILDGFPRTLPQAEALRSIARIDVVFNIQLPEEVIIKKIISRRLCKNCGAIYSLTEIRDGTLYMPAILPQVQGRCDVCSGELTQRTDDKPDVARKRLKEYHKQTEPLVAYYAKQNLIRDIHVVGNPDKMLEIFLAEIKSVEEMQPHV